MTETSYTAAHVREGVRPSRRPARINPDSRAVLVVALSTTIALALVSFLLSFNGLADAATWANVPPWLAWGVPAYVDGAILVYTVAALVYRARGETARLAWASLGLYASLSVAANGAHAWADAPEELRIVLGVLLAGLAPVAVVLTTHTIARLVVAPPSLRDEWDAVAPAVEEGLVEGLTSAHAWDVPPSLAEAAATVSSSRPAASRAPLSRAETAERNARILSLAEADPAMSYRDIADAVGTSKSTVARVLGKPEEVLVEA